MSRSFCLPVVLAALAAPGLASAQEQEASLAMQTARTMALGGGGHGLSSSTSGLFVNPAAMGQTRAYHVDSTVLYDPSISRWGFSGAVADTTRERFGAGTAYTFNTISGGENPHESHEFRLAVSANLAESISLGVTGRYIDYRGRTTANGRLGTKYEGVTVDVGALFRPVRMFAIGVTGYSLSNPGTALSPLALGTGIGFFPIESLSINADAFIDFGTFGTARVRWSGGAELLVQRVPIRIGYTDDDTRLVSPVHIVTAGVGYIDERFGVEAAMRQEVAGGNQTSILLNLRYFHTML